MNTLKSSRCKVALLTGTALITLGAFSAQARAADLTLGADGTWASAGGANSTPLTDVTNATAGDNVDVDTNTWTITDTAATDDSTAAGSYVLGAITDTNTGAAGTGGVLITSTAGEAAPIVTIGSAAVAGDFDVTNTNADNLDITAAVTGALTVGGDLNVVNLEATSAADIVLTVGGTATVTGATAITGGDAAGTSATVNFDGNTAFTGAVTVLGGGDAGGTADLTLSGATNAFDGGLVITDATGAATVTLDGAVAQTVSGAISGDGDITITNTNASGVTFSGANTNTGTLTVNNDANDQSVVFTGDVSSAIALGDNSGADTITATFGGSSATAVSGVITGGAAETVAVNFAGGDTVTLTAAVIAADTTSITGSTTVTTNSNFASAAVTVASGSTLATTANTITGAIANAGTVTMGGGDITGNITGSGALSATADGTLTGSVSNAVTIADNVTLTVDATTGDETISGAVVINDSGVDDGLAIDDQGNTVTVSGAITTGTDGQGLITIADTAGTVAFTGNVGTSSAAVGALTVAGGTGNTVTTTGNLYVDAITLNDADTLSFIGSSAQVVSGTITDGILTQGATSNVTYNGVISSAVSQTLTAGASATYNADATFTGAYTNTGSTTTVAVGSTLSADSFTDDGSYVLNAADADGALTAADVGQITDSGADGTITASNVSINQTGRVTAGAFTITGVNLGAATLVDNSVRNTYTTVNAGANTTVTVTEATLVSLADNSATTATGTVLDSLTAGASAQLDLINNAVSAASTSVAANNVIEAAASDVSGGAVVAGISVASQTSAVTNTRLASLRSGDVTGMAAGGQNQGLSAWVQGFGQLADQDERDGVSGYEADTYGLAVGIDTKNLGEDLTVGLAFAYADTDVESDSISRASTNVDSYQFSLYGNYDINERTYVTGQLGYIMGDNDTTRNAGGISSLTANGNYDSDIITARAELARDYASGSNLTLTPRVMVNYMRYSADSYTETGAGGANLTVDSNDLDLLEIGVGIDAGFDVKNADGSHFKPKLNLGVRHDVIGDEYQATNTFSGGGNAFQVKGFDPAQTTFNAGLNLTYVSTDAWELSAKYDFEYKSDYTANSGMLKAAYKF